MALQPPTGQRQVMHRRIQRRLCYSVEKKNQVVMCALRSSPMLAATNHGVNVKRVYEWIQARRQIATEAGRSPNRKRRLRQNCEFVRTNVEVPLVEHVEEILRHRDAYLREILKEARRIFNATPNPRRVQFKASDGWARNFVRRNFPQGLHRVPPPALNPNPVVVPGVNPAGNIVINQPPEVLIIPNQPIPVVGSRRHQLLGCSIM